MQSVRFVTFGCKANQYDTQVLREALLRRGMTEAQKQADLLVVNTCTVTAEAGRKARQLIRRVHREAPDTQVCVTGCLAESEPDVLRELPGVQWVLGNGEAKRPIQFLRELGHEFDPEELGIPAGITQFQGHTRAFLKIQDGCDQACSFCIIPSVRGKSRSRSIAELEHEVQRLVAAGHVEIVLCGIHIGHWGRDLGLALPDLLQALVNLPAKNADGQETPFRLRLSSIEATEVCERTLDVLADHPDRIAPHLHMPLQSGSAEILQAMNRWYGPEEYLAACERIRERLDQPALTADVLGGLPGGNRAPFPRDLGHQPGGGILPPARVSFLRPTGNRGLRARQPRRAGGHPRPPYALVGMGEPGLPRLLALPGWICRNKWFWRAFRAFPGATSECKSTPKPGRGFCRRWSKCA